MQRIANIIVNLSLVGLLLFCVTTISAYSYLSFGRLRITFLDIGQGDSFLISTPDHYQLLVDAGRDNKARDKLSQTMLPWERLDAVLLTHPDGDHVGEMGKIVKARNVGRVFFNRIDHNNALYTEFLQALNSDNAEIGLTQGDVWQIGCCVVLEVLWPTKQELNVAEPEPNHLSIGFLLRYGKFSLFAAGDADSEVEISLAERIQHRRLTVLKVGHHGSNTSTGLDFVQKLKPEVAAIQVGQNSYGHPNPGVLANLAAEKVQVFRNDLHGDILVSSDGENYFVTPEKVL